MPRAVVCLVCNKIEKMVDPPADIPLVPARVTWMEDGREREYFFKDPETGETAMVPEYDPVMEDFVARHRHDRPDTESLEYIKVWQTDQATWERMDVVSEIKKELAEQQNLMVEESNHYRDEAVRCYNAHNNPDTKVGCRDFLDDSKRIGRGDIPKKHQIFLCHMCPYMQTYVAQEVRWKNKLYDPHRAKKRRNRR